MPSRNTGERRNSQLLMSSGVTPLSSPEGRGGGGRVGGWILRKQVFEGLQLREEREREGERIEEEGGRAGEGGQGRRGREGAGEGRERVLCGHVLSKLLLLFVSYLKT